MGTYRVHCLTENLWLPVTSLTVPSTCPNNAAHTIAPEDTALLSAITKVPQTYSGVVAQDGTGDFLTIADAFAAGCISVLVRRGFYIETQDVPIPEAGLLIGENAGSVIITFPTGKGIRADGNGGIVHTAGTISVTSGTNFTAIGVGAFVLLDNHYYEIGTVVSATVAALVLPYNGATITNAPLRAQNMLTGSSLRNIIVVQSTGTALMFRAVRHGTVENCLFKYNAPNVIVDSCSDIAFKNTISEASAGVGMHLTACYNVLIESTGCKNNFAHGMVLQQSYNVYLDSSSCMANAGNGVYMVASQRVSVSGGSYNSNAGAGINSSMPGNSMVVVVAAVAERNGATGIHFGDTLNVASGCILFSNGSHGIKAGNKAIITTCHCINNAGNGVDVDNNDDGNFSSNILSNNGGHGIYLDNCTRNTVTGNRCAGNGANGIYLGPGSLTNIMITNILSDNVGLAYQDLGISNTVEQNII